jgi:hypothetical protein
MASSFAWNFIPDINPGFNPGTGNFTLFTPSGYANPNYIQFSKTDKNSVNADSLLSTLMSKTSFAVIVDSQNYIVLRVNGSADYGEFYRFNINDSFTIVKVGSVTTTGAVVTISDTAPEGGGGSGGGGGTPPVENEVTWIAVGAFPNKVAQSVTSGKSWTQVTPIVPLEEALCGRKGGSLIVIGGVPTALGTSMYSVAQFGDAWTSIQTGLVRCNAIQYNGTEWMAVGKGSEDINCAYTSLDGIEWTRTFDLILNEALNVYWMESTWIVVGKCQVIGSPCMFARTSKCWLGVDTALTYENFNFDSIKSITRYDTKLLFMGELEGQDRYGFIDWAVSEPTKSQVGAGEVKTEIVSNGAYLLSFDLLTNTLTTSANGTDWIPVTTMNDIENPTSKRLIARSLPDSTQTVNVGLFEEFFGLLNNYIGETATGLEEINQLITVVKGVTDKCVEYYDESATLKTEIGDLKTRLQGMYDQVESYIDGGLPIDIVNINIEKTRLRTVLTNSQNQWGLPNPINNLTFDDSGENYNYTVAIANYETALENYSIMGQLQVDNYTLGIINTAVGKVNFHLELTKAYQTYLKEYITLLLQRDTIYTQTYERKLEEFIEITTSIVDAILTKFNRVAEIKTILDSYVTLIPQSYSDIKIKFAELNATLAIPFNADYAMSFADERPWVLNLFNSDLVKFDYTATWDDGFLTLGINLKSETELDGYIATFYTKFPNTTFDKDATDPIFSEMSTLFTEIETLKNESTALDTSITALYDLEQIQLYRQSEITEYDAYLVKGVAYNILTTLDEYIVRDTDKLDELENTRLSFQPIVDEQTRLIEAAFESARLAALDKEQKRLAAAAAAAAYLQSAEYKALQEALLKQLEDQQAAQSLINQQQLELEEAERLRLVAYVAELQAQNERDAANQVSLEESEALLVQTIANEVAMAAKAFADLEAKRLAEVALENQITQLFTTFNNTRLTTARLLYYMFYELIVYNNAYDTHKKPYFLYSLIRSGNTTQQQYLLSMKAILDFTRLGLQQYENLRPYTLDGITDIIQNYDSDFGSIKQNFIRVYNSFYNAIPDIEDYLTSITVSSDISIIKVINNEVGISIETKYNALRTAITDEIANLVSVNDVTLSITDGVTIRYDQRTPLGCVSFSDQTLFFNNVITTVPSGNILSIKKITMYIYQLKNYVECIKRIAETYSYVSQQKIELAESRTQVASQLPIVDLSTASSVATLFQNVDAALQSMPISLNNSGINVAIVNPDDAPNLFSALLPRYFQTRKINIQKLADIVSDDNDLLLDTAVLRGISEHFTTSVFGLNAQIVKLREREITTAYNQTQSLKAAMYWIFREYVTHPAALQIEDLYIKYRQFSTYSNSDFVSITRFANNLLFLINGISGYAQAKKNYYIAYSGCIANDIPPYPDALTQPVHVDPGFTQWLNSRTHYMLMESFKKQFGDTVSQTLETLSIIQINTYLTLLATVENEWLTSVTPTYIQNLQTADNVSFLNSYRANAINYVASVLPILPVAIFPSTDDVVKFNVTGITTSIRTTSTTLQGYGTQTFSTQTIPQITASISYFKTLVESYAAAISSLEATIVKIAKYKADVQLYTSYVTDLKDVIDRKENIVTNYLNGPTPLDLVISDGTAKPFIMSIKPTNTYYWEELSGESELNYTLFDNNWGYFVGDKTSYNKKVYRLKNATPLHTYESGLLLINNPPLFPKTNSTTEFFTANANFWTFALAAYNETTSRPTLNELRSYNGDLYKCVQLYTLEEAVTDPTKRPDRWKLIPQSDYVSEGAIQYYNSTQTYVEDEEVLFKFQYRSFENEVTHRLGKFKAVRIVTESYPTRFSLPRLEIGNTLRPDLGYIDPVTGVVDPETIPYGISLVGGNRTTQIPRYGTYDDDQWRVTGLLRELRYSVAIGPEMAILRAFTRREQVEDLLYVSRATNVTVTSPAFAMGDNAPDDATTVWNSILSSFETQYARLNSQITGTPSGMLESTMRPVYAKAYSSVCYVLDNYLQDMTFLVGEMNILKQRLYSIYQNHIDDNAADYFDSELSTTGNVVFRDLGIGEKDSIFTDYYNRSKGNYDLLKDKIQHIFDNVNRILALDLVDNTLTQTNYNAVALGGGIISESSVLSIYHINRYHPIGITDWEYAKSSYHVSQAELSEYQFPIMSRVKRLIAEVAKKPAYIKNTAHLIPSTDPTVNTLFKITVGLAIIAKSLTSTILDLNGFPGTADPLEQAGKNRRNMKAFAKTIQANIKSSTTSVTITREFIDSIEIIRTNINTLEDNVALLEDTQRGLLREPTTINPGTPPTSVATTTPLPSDPAKPLIRDLIADNNAQLADARKALADAEKALNDIKATGSPKPILPGKDITEIVEKGRPPTKAVTHNVVNTTYVRSGGNISVTGAAGTGTRRFGTDFQGIPPSTPATIKAQAATITDTTNSLVAQTDDALQKEFDARKAALDAQLTEAERITLANREIEIQNSDAMKEYNKQLDAKNKALAEIEETRRQSRIDFEKADADYKAAVRASDARTAEIADIRAKNAKILAQNEELLKTSQNALDQARTAQRTYTATQLSTTAINTTVRSSVIINTIRRLTAVQFVVRQYVKAASLMSRTSVLVASSAAGRFASRIAASRTGNLLGKAGGFLLEPAINMGIGFHTAITEGLFDD